MRCTILTFGSRGHVQPCVALGVGLEQHGHTVLLAAPERFRPLAGEYGLDFFPLAGDPEPILAATFRRAGGRPRPLHTAWVVARYVRRFGSRIFAGAQAACRPAEVILHSFATASLGHQIAQMQGKADFAALIFPFFSPTSAFPNLAFPPLPLGGLYDRGSHIAFDWLYWQISRWAYAAIRGEQPDLPPLAPWPFGREAATPILYGFSPLVVPPPMEWSSRPVAVTGYWFLPARPGWRPPVELQRFLEAGPAPVYVGFGSLSQPASLAAADLAVRALLQSGRRAVVLVQTKELQALATSPQVFRTGFIPFDWLFPRMAAVISHGGAGTTAAALRAGIPSISIPFGTDQPFWSRRMYELGVAARPLSLPHLTGEALAQALEAALGNERMRQRAAQVSQRLAAENGVQAAVEHLTAWL